MAIREDAEEIIREAIKAVMPQEAVKRALQQKSFTSGRVYVVAVGKAAWQMGKAAFDYLGNRMEKGFVLTKYGHCMGEIPGFVCMEAGHPICDENTYHGTQYILEQLTNLNREDTIVFLLSGGGSALFEKPLIEEEQIQKITEQLLHSGADIVEINTIRKRLSAVKGGRFAKLCEPAQIYSIVLSDVLGDPIDMIASGPAYPDSSTYADAKRILEKYHIVLGKTESLCLQQETPKVLKNVETYVTGNVKQLCKAVADGCKRFGYEPQIVTEYMDCEAKEAGAFIASIAKTKQDTKKSLAYIFGGETVVHVEGNGKGGRNQELVLLAAQKIKGLNDTAICSIGSDGTDGPTDAAGGYCDGKTYDSLKEQGIDIFSILENNDAYHALEKCQGLIKTGPTGTNVNDVTLLLIHR